MTTCRDRRRSNNSPDSATPSLASKRISSVDGTAPHDLALLGVPSPHAFARQIGPAEPESRVVQIDEVHLAIEHILSGGREGKKRFGRRTLHLADRDHRNGTCCKPPQMPQKLAIA